MSRGREQEQQLVDLVLAGERRIGAFRAATARAHALEVVDDRQGLVDVRLRGDEALQVAHRRRATSTRVTRSGASPSMTSVDDLRAGQRVADALVVDAAPGGRRLKKRR